MTPRRQGAATPEPRFRFGRRLKLTRAADFEKVFEQGRRSADPLFTVLYWPSGLEHARLGMTASAKSIRTAVARNRVRRAVRESFRHAEPALPGLDVVVIIRPAAGRASTRQMTTSLASHWARLQRAHAGESTLREPDSGG